MRWQSLTTERSAARPAGLRGTGRLHPGWIIGIFLSSLALVACVIVAAAWTLGGRAVSTTSTVQELLPPQPRVDDAGASVNEVNTASGLQPPVGTADEYVVDEAATVLPGAREASPITEIPTDSVAALKSMGWVVPYLSRSGFEHEYVETTSLDGVRTIQVRLTDGENYVNVSETRVEDSTAELVPLSEKLTSIVNLDSVTSESVELTSGHSVNVYRMEEGSSWTAAVENGAAHYVITSDLSSETAAEVASWVLVTDRSRLQMLPSSPGTADRLDRGFEELFDIFDR